MIHSFTLSLGIIFFALPSFAQTLKTQIVHSKAPGDRIDIYCTDTDCSELQMKFYYRFNLDHERSISMLELDRRASQTLTRESMSQKLTHPYRATQDYLEKTRTSWSRGKKAEAIAHAALVLANSAIDTATLPLSPALHYAVSYRPGKWQKKSAIRLQEYLESDSKIIRLKNRPFNQLFDQL